ncbi:MAG: Fic family protein [Gammaproteobacteria bacterium]|nr:Fic family protein [Gammaproteobacteria bacterium]
MNARQTPPIDSQAVQRLRDRLRLRPDDGRAWLELARNLSRGAPGQELFHAIEQSIRSLPENDEVWSLAAAVQERIRGPEAARQWLEHTAEQNPGLAAPQFALARLESARNPEKAVDRYRGILAKFPTDTRAKSQLEDLQIRLGDAHREAGHWRTALAAYREVESARAHDPAVMNNIGCCLMGLESPDEAEGYFARALALDPRLVQARLNAGLIHAYRGDNAAAISAIEQILEKPDLHSALRKSARTLVDIMTEQQRLAPVISRSLESGCVDELQSALESAPERLLQPDPAFMEKLGSLAGQLRELSPVPELPPRCEEAAALPLIEALALCKVEWRVEEFGALAERLADPENRFAPDSREHAVRIAWKACLDRRDQDVTQLQGAAGEAWLRYWHARLLGMTPDKHPGQFKAVANTAQDLTLTPPEFVPGTVRSTLADLRPTLPDGACSAAFQFLSLIAIHGFSDGNGRIAQFVLNWEAERAGLPTFVIDQDMRQPISRSKDQAWLHGDFGPLFTDLARTAVRTEQFLEQLRGIPVPPDFSTKFPL